MLNWQIVMCLRALRAGDYLLQTRVIAKPRPPQPVRPATMPPANGLPQ